MGKAAAVFDVDGTLVRGKTERLFFLQLLRLGRLKPAKALAFLTSLAARPQHRFVNKTYLAGMEVGEAVRLGRRCFREVVLPRLRPRGLACVRSHQGAGREIVLLTGSLAFLVLPLQEHLGADWLIATELAQEGDFFTGHLLGPHPRGENKRLLLEELARRQGLDLSSSYAYGDHLEDAPLLCGVGRPAVVNPTWRLRRLARERGWPIEHF